MAKKLKARPLQGAKQTTKGHGKAGSVKADKAVKSKRVGWRLSDVGAKKAKKSPFAAPSAEDVAKGRAYWENRANRSDKKPAKKFGRGGFLGLGI